MGHQKYTHTHTFCFSNTAVLAFHPTTFVKPSWEQNLVVQDCILQKLMLPLPTFPLFCLPIFWPNNSLEKRFKPLTFFPVYPVFYFLVNANSQLIVDSPTVKQNLLSSAIDQPYLKAILTDLDALDKERLLSCGMPHANAWIWALSVGTSMLSCLGWQICMKRWLEIVIFESEH